MPDKPLSAVALALACGILAAAWVPLSGCLLFVCVPAVVLVLVRPAGNRSVAAIILASFAVGAFRYAVGREVPRDDVSRLAGRARAIRATVVSDPEPRADRVRLLLRVNRARVASRWVHTTGIVSANVYEPAAGDLRLDYGDRVTVEASIYVPSEPTNPGQFSWRGYLARQGVYACASVRERSQVVLAGRRGGSPATRVALAARRYVVRSIARTHADRESALVSGMVLGAYSYLPPNTVQDFTRTGTLHVLAASGLNCLVVVLIASPVLTALRVVPRHRNAVLILLLAAYLMIVGPKPSLVRATVMASLFLMGRLLRRVPYTKNLFFAAAIVVLIMNPSHLFDVGFQLSFAGVWALLCVAPVIESFLRKAGWLTGTLKERPPMLPLILQKMHGGLFGTVVATVAVTLVTAPLVAYYFNYVSLVSLPANIVMWFAVPVVFADSLLSATVGWVPGLGSVVGGAGTLVARWMTDTVHVLASPTWSSVSVSSQAPLALIGYYVALFGLFDYLRARNAA